MPPEDSPDYFEQPWDDESPEIRRFVTAISLHLVEGTVPPYRYGLPDSVEDALRDAFAMVPCEIQIPGGVARLKIVDLVPVTELLPRPDGPPPSRY